MIEIDMTTAKQHLAALTKEACDNVSETTYAVNKQRKEVFGAEKRLSYLRRLPKKKPITRGGVLHGPDVFCSFTADMNKAEEDIELLNKELEVLSKEQFEAQSVAKSLMTSRHQLKAFSDVMRLEAEIPKLCKKAAEYESISRNDFRQAWERLKYLSESQSLMEKAEEQKRKLALTLAVFED